MLSLFCRLFCAVIILPVLFSSSASLTGISSIDKVVTCLEHGLSTLTLYPTQTCSCLRKRQDLCGGSRLCQGGIPVATFVCSFSLAAAGLAYPFPHSTPPLHESYQVKLPSLLVPSPEQGSKGRAAAAWRM